MVYKGETPSLGDRFRRTQRRVEASGVDTALRETLAELGVGVPQIDLLAHYAFYTRA